MKAPWREEPPKLCIQITQTLDDYLNPEYVGETARKLWRNNSWNAGKQINKNYKLTPHKTNKQKAELRIQKLPTIEEEFKVYILPNDRALVGTSSFQLKTQKSHIL